MGHQISLWSKSAQKLTELFAIKMRITPHIINIGARTFSIKPYLVRKTRRVFRYLKNAELEKLMRNKA
ncbi:hypothetical protein GCM10011445_26400 [Pseudocitrobacter faecalis]|nr:hypothetical protein GCM10011445_26400 [Pseudocitrobacter faecalis]